jgi:hypothetical protein
MAKGNTTRPRSTMRTRPDRIELQLSTTVRATHKGEGTLLERSTARPECRQTQRSGSFRESAAEVRFEDKQREGTGRGRFPHNHAKKKRVSSYFNWS